MNYGCMGSPALKTQAVSLDIEPSTPFSKDDQPALISPLPEPVGLASDGGRPDGLTWAPGTDV